ncbi:MAG: ATP-binding protein [candidate division FCPU426 bacterium]
MTNPPFSQSGGSAPPSFLADRNALPAEDVEHLMKKLSARIRQLRSEIESRQEENERIIAENLKQNEELRLLNQGLDQVVQERTRELEASKHTLETQNQELQELSESKEAMMHMIVHDLKNPLTTVMGALTLSLHPRFELPEDLRGLMKDANVRAIQLRAMIDDILVISQMRSREFQPQTAPTELNSLIQQSLQLMNATKSVKPLQLIFHPASDDVIAAIDYQMIERVVNNLINNAMKYAPAGSEIVLDLERAGAWAKVSVANQGEAIPPNCHGKIFELFGRAKPQDRSIQGTGLGLAFCKLAVEAHGGTISVESPLPGSERGARFTLTLPLAVQP